MEKICQPLKVYWHLDKWGEDAAHLKQLQHEKYLLLSLQGFFVIADVRLWCIKVKFTGFTNVTFCCHIQCVIVWRLPSFSNSVIPLRTSPYHPSNVLRGQSWWKPLQRGDWSLPVGCYILIYHLIPIPAFCSLCFLNPAVKMWFWKREDERPYVPLLFKSFLPFHQTKPNFNLIRHEWKAWNWSHDTSQCSGFIEDYK